jgi:hypothetical protein
MTLAGAGLAVMALNVPFGFWRAGARKLSWQWFLAVHAPVPLVVAVRLFGGLGWHWTSFVVLIASYGAGQLLGGRMRSARHAS